MRGSDAVDVAIHADQPAPTWDVGLTHPMELAQAAAALLAAVTLAAVMLAAVTLAAVTLAVVSVLLSTMLVAGTVPTQLFKQVLHPAAP